MVIDCGGTAQCGVYPRKKIPTINLTPSADQAPLAAFMPGDTYVSGVTVNTLHPVQGDAAGTAGTATAAGPRSVPPRLRAPAAPGAPASEGGASGGGGLTGLIAGMGRATGKVVGVFFASGRRSIDQVIRTILPFIAFLAMLMGIITYSGLGSLIAHVMTPLAGSLPGLLVLSAVCGLPFLSPVLGPGAVIAQVIGVLVGQQIAAGTIGPQFALPALFAFDSRSAAIWSPWAWPWARRSRKPFRSVCQRS